MYSIGWVGIVWEKPTIFFFFYLKKNVNEWGKERRGGIVWEWEG
jgi:hypothetical protein